jgi:hypothetical protein
MGQCHTTFKIEGKGAGQVCLTGCSKQCYDKCLAGKYEMPSTVGLCDAPECKIMKRTLLDIEGVFSHESAIGRPDNMFGAQFTNPNATEFGGKSDSGIGIDSTTLMPVVNNDPGEMDLSQMAHGLGLGADEVEEIIKGRPTRSGAGGSMSNILMQLPKEDRDELRKLEGGGAM